jgi:hypothetical protein
LQQLKVRARDAQTEQNSWKLVSRTSPFRSKTNYAEEFDRHQDTASLQSLSTPFKALQNVDYNKAQPGKPAPALALKDIPDGGVAAADIVECANLCIQTPPCNMASWYGESQQWTDPRNCWLKELEQPCQYPPDLEKDHSDNRYLLLARPPTCAPPPNVCVCFQLSVFSAGICATIILSFVGEGEPLIAPSPPSTTPPSQGERGSGGVQLDTSANSTDDSPDKEETINTPEEQLAILGNRVMDEAVPKAYQIENTVNAAYTIGRASTCSVVFVVGFFALLM